MKTLRNVLIAAGLVLVVGGRLYHFFGHPEWTEPQALRALWPLWLAALFMLLGGFLLDYRRTTWPE